MLKLDLRRIFEDKGIDKPSLFMKKNGFTAHTTHRLLHSKVDSISFKHLEKICLLLNCTIEDLFAWINEDKTGIYKDHPLNKLKRGKSRGMITNKLKDLPLDKLEQVRTFLDGLSNTKS